MIMEILEIIIMVCALFLCGIMTALLFYLFGISDELKRLREERKKRHDRKRKASNDGKDTDGKGGNTTTRVHKKRTKR